MNNFFHPIIIIGMHRSGTSLVTKLLRDLGLFVGWDYNDEYEAMFFLNRNEKILKSCSSGWDNPAPIDKLLNNYQLRKKVVNTLAEDLHSIKSLYYWGPKHLLKNLSMANIKFPWGWKDPRNTFTLPLWLDLFPKAKIIHVYRNGLDIAQSLITREERRFNRILKNNNNGNGVFQSQVKQLNKNGHLLYLVNKIQNIYGKISPLYKYEDFKIHFCDTLENSFELWCLYIERAFNYLNNSKNEVIHIKYEDFLLDPEKHLAQLSEFCSLSHNNDNIKSIIGSINPNRRFAFKNDELLVNYYHKVKNNYWMSQLGYNFKSLQNSH